VSGREIGRVATLYRYPVKSMGAESLSSAAIGWHGLAGDRRWAFIRPHLESSGFPWLTIRERPDLWHYQPSFVEPERPDASATRVRTPGGVDFEVQDPALAAELGPGVRVIRQHRGVFDVAPLSLITTRTVASLGASLAMPLRVERFRPNLVIEPADDVTDDFPEDAWVGAVVRVGEMRMRIDQRDQRCVMVNVDPETTSREPSVLRTIARERDACLGVYGTTVQPGHVAAGDRVVLEL
jgi:uncharacterized protein YcbX